MIVVVRMILVQLPTCSVSLQMYKFLAPVIAVFEPLPFDQSTLQHQASHFGRSYRSRC